MPYFGIPPLKNEGESIPVDYGRSSENSEEVRVFRPAVTVGDLIAALKQYPLEQRVMVRGYESGFDDPSPLSIIRVQIDPYDSSVYGDYEEATAPEGFDAVLIDR